MLSPKRLRDRRKLHWLAPPVLQALEPRTLLTSYYLSPSGSDAASGTSASAPWKSFAKINALNLEPGDNVLLQGGATFNAPSPSATNLVNDSGFESGNFNTWTQSQDATAGNSSITTTSTDIHSGTKALKISGSTDGGRGEIVTSRVVAGHSYLLKLWAKLSSGTGGADGGITFFNGTTQVAIASFPITGTGYKQYTAAIVAPANFTYADVWVTKDAGTSVLCADDFTLNESFGTLAFNADDSGTASQPVTLGSYGSGRATLNVGDGFGVYARDIAGFAVRDLVINGTWNGLTATGANVATGLAITNQLDNDTTLNYIRVDNVETSGFKWAGMSVSGDNGMSGYDDVRITNCSAHDNGDIGIAVQGTFDASSTAYSNSDVYIGYCKSYNNGGLPGIGRNSGSGMIVGDTDVATMERNVAWNNGQNCNYANGGPIGIWAWDSNAVVIQYNESYANQTATSSLDGGGFDLDGGCTNSIMQYNYSHDNDGAGYLLYQFTGARPFGNNIIRYNISQNDARQSHYAGIYLGGGTGVANNQIYNNTIYLTPTSDSTIAAIKLTSIGTGNKFRNNILYATGSVAPVYSSTAYTTSSALFQGNDYYTAGAIFGIKWGSTTYADLASWRATGEEKNGSTFTGTSSNPQLVSAGGGGTLGDASLLNTLTAYELLASSPMINAGMNLATLGVTAGGPDFFGQPAPAGSSFDIGAFESASTINGFFTDDTFLLRLNAAGKIEIFLNTPTTSRATFVWAKGVYNSLSINGNGGADALTIDLLGGNPIPNGGASFNGGDGADSLIIAGTAGSDTVAVSSSSVAPTGTGPAVAYSAIGSIQANTGDGDDTLLINGSPSAAVTYNSGSGNDSLLVNSGVYTFPTAAGAGGGAEQNGATSVSNLNVSVALGASIVFQGAPHLAALAVAGNATLAAGTSTVLITRTLSITGNGRLDVNDNAMIVDYGAGSASPLGSWDGSSYNGITGWISAGGVNSGPSGAAIFSSLADQTHFIVAAADASDLYNFASTPGALFAGQTVDSSSVLIRFTYSGDANLSGNVTGDDYFAIDSHYYTASPPAFVHGDLNLDGKLNGDDLFLVDATYFYQWLDPL